MTQIIDGKKISQEIKDELREQVAEQKKLGKEAVLHADMCLGEGTGAVLLFPLLDAALAEYQSAHTFGEIELKPYEELK